QANASPLDARSDIFSLGIVFWEALTTTRLFRGESDLHSLRLIREEPLRAPSELAEWVDPDIDAVVMRMLERDPAKRFASCDDVVRALTPIVERLHSDQAGLAAFIEGLGVTEHGVEGGAAFPKLMPVGAPTVEARKADTVVLVSGARPFEDSPHTVTSSI